MCKHTYSFRNPKQLERFGITKHGNLAECRLSETPTDRPTCREFTSAAQLYRQPRQEARHYARAMDRAVSASQQEGLSQVDLADALELQPISLVRLLDRLVEHGLLERRPDPKDRRANRLFLTKRAATRRRSRQPARRDRLGCAARRSGRCDPDQPRSLVDVKERIKGLAETSDHIVAKYHRLH